ncbi:MAG: DUF4252 domain-containing protein [Bacteroidaceae bacterium]|nr:DUF4252 domain-containing protein [Bacteroidaceae bacterium]
MKRKLFIMLTLMFTVLSTWATPPQQPHKSEAEKFVQNLAKIKSDEISYAYISANMFKQLFIKTDLDEEIQESISFIKSLKSLRRFFTNGKQGYDVMKAALQPLLQEKEEVLGMTLMASNRDGGGMVAIYSGLGNTLVVTDYGNNTTITVVFVAGLSYESFLEFNDLGINFY